MSKRELKKAVLRALAAEVDGGAIDWHRLCETDEDEARLDNVLQELADEFSRRGGEFE